MLNRLSFVNRLPFSIIIRRALWLQSMKHDAAHIKVGCVKDRNMLRISENCRYLVDRREYGKSTPNVFIDLDSSMCVFIEEKQLLFTDDPSVPKNKFIFTHFIWAHCSGNFESAQANWFTSCYYIKHLNTYCILRHNKQKWRKTYIFERVYVLTLNGHIYWHFQSSHFLQHSFSDFNQTIWKMVSFFLF